MPDWSYRTLLRTAFFRLPARQGSDLALGVLALEILESEVNNRNDEHRRTEPSRSGSRSMFDASPNMADVLYRSALAKHRGHSQREVRSGELVLEAPTWTH
jgi:hypothetical protein